MNVNSPEETALSTDVVTAPAPLPRPEDWRPRVFLGGSIDMGSAPDWQREVVAALSGIEAVLLNPRRRDWDPSIQNDANVPAFQEQVEWELAALEAADVIVLYLASGLKSPITLMELGLHARGGRIILFCEEGYWRKGNVDLLAQRYGIRQVTSLAALTDAVRQVVKTLRQAPRSEPRLPGS